MEERSLEKSHLFSWVFYPIWIVLTIIQVSCFILVNGKFHPLAKILEGSNENDVDQGKFDKNFKDIAKDVISYFSFLL